MYPILYINYIIYPIFISLNNFTVSFILTLASLCERLPIRKSLEEHKIYDIYLMMFLYT